jgi:predicted adenine nucleotide alpha hydrolase (AANH) superfamily ATPase
MKLLMHMCCANCSLYPLKHLQSRSIDVKGLWFNPNIHPEEEYRRRLGALRELESRWGLDVEYVDRYGIEDFRESLRGHRGLRCEICYETRLGETARTARKMGLDGFTTTLLVSPYQRFDLIVDTGRRLEKKYSVRFYAEDFRPGWREAVRLSREMGLYRQKYCGCLYSRAEREAAGKARSIGRAAAAAGGA